VTAAVPTYGGYVFDLDGTLILGDHALPGASETVSALRARGASLRYLTNKPLERGSDYAATLTRLAIPAEPGDVVTSVDALIGYLRRHHPHTPALPVAEGLVTDLLLGAGLHVTHDPVRAGVVVVSFDRTFDYAKLLAAYRAVRGGAAIVATNPDPYCPTPDGGLPDCAAMLAAIEVSTGVRAEAVVGKPSVHMARTLLDRLGVAPEQTLLVGDRLDTDVAMGLQAGLDVALVLTGATSREDLARSPLAPTFVLEHLTQLLPGSGSQRSASPTLDPGVQG
jgi:NagD protein